MVTDPFLKETYNKAFDYLRKEPGKEIHAFLLFRELARLQPEYWRIHIFQGEALCELGRYQDAIFATQLAQDRAPYKKFSITVLREAQIHRLYLHRTLADEIFDWAIKSDESPPAFYWILKGANLARWESSQKPWNAIEKPSALKQRKNTATKRI